MIFNMTSGGGNTALNFKVVGNPQPSNPSKNTIWVDTDIEITSWHFCATEPNIYDEGAVWIRVINESDIEFNALKKNGIMAYPLSAKQYVNGAWVKKDTKIYNDSAWSDLASWILSSGKTTLAMIEHRQNTHGSNIEVGADNITFSAYREGGDGNYKCALCGYATDEPIDFTNIDTITVNINCEIAGYSGDNSSGAFIAVSANKQNFYGQVVWSEHSIVGERTIEVDVSSISGEYYLAYGAFAYVAISGSMTGKIRFYDVYME